jgi:hypothetical protein
MSTSSAKQAEFDFSDASEFNVGGENRNSTARFTAVVKLPTFDYPSVAYAASSRIAGRINAASISPAEHQGWLDERQRLLDKEFAGTITREEMNRLKYVRWSLDRVDDARYGPDLDVLDSAVTRFERLQSDMHELQKQLSSFLPHGRRT